jgi:hypothetical protein
MDASSGAGPDGRQESNAPKHIENDLCDMLRRAEHDERMATVQALTQGPSDVKLRTNTPEHESAYHDTSSNSAGKIGPEIAPGTAESDLIPGLEMSMENGNHLGPKLRQSLPQPRRDSPSALPLHLVPLLPQGHTPPSKRPQPSIDLFLDKNDDDPTDLHGHGSLPHATGETLSTSQSETLQSKTRAAGSFGISRTLTYAMTGMESTTWLVGSPALIGGEGKLERLVTSKGAEACHKEDIGSERETAKLEETSHQIPRETGGVQADAIATMRNATAQQMDGGGATHKEAQVGTRNLEGQREELRLQMCVRKEEEIQFLAPRKPKRVTFADGGTRRTGEDAKAAETEAWRVVEDQDHEGPEGELRAVFEGLATRETEDPIVAHQNLILAQSRTESGFTNLKEREMEIRRARSDLEILEERFQVIERDLCNRLERVRQNLEAIRQRKASIDRQEDGLRKMLLAASREEGLEEDWEAKLVTAEQPQGLGVEMETDALSEESSRDTVNSVKSVSSYNDRTNWSCVLKDRIRTRSKTA